MKNRIGILTHYGAMESESKHLAQELDCELVFRRGVLEYAVAAAVEMEQELGVEAIIGTGKTISYISKYVSVPTISLPKPRYNALIALYRAKSLGKLVAFVDTIGDDELLDYEEMAEVAGCKVRRYLLDTADQSDEIIKEIIADGCDVVVSSASCMMGKARVHNIPHIQVKVAEREMDHAIKTAQHMISIQVAEARRTGYMRTVVNSSVTATFTLGDDDRVNFVNSKAVDVLRTSERAMVGHTLNELAADSEFFRKLIKLEEDLDIVKADGTELLVMRNNITATDGRHVGVLYHLQDPKSIQQQELFVRKKAREQGFVATHTFDDILGRSACIQAVIEEAAKYAATSSSILITGESGCGKELFAQSMHNRSSARSGPFLAVNCATLPENLLESELFGYEEGSFTGAKRGGKPGLLELAHMGTLFLDEIGEMPMLLQSKLLRVIQERQVRRIGGEKNIPIDVRIISATNRDLRKEVSEGNFRADLFYRINVLSLHIPPLRERKEDISDLAECFARNVAAQNNKAFLFSNACYEEMKKYDWPGNVRELSNFVERVVVLASQNVATPDTVLGSMQDLGLRSKPATPGADCEDALYIPLGTMKDMEMEIFRQVYDRVNGNKKTMEHMLDISNTTLWRRLREL